MEITTCIGSKKRSRKLFPNAIPSIFDSPTYFECLKVEQEIQPTNTTTDINIEPIYENPNSASDEIHDKPNLMLISYRDQFCRTCLNHCNDGSSISVDSQIQNMAVLDMLIHLTAFEAESNDAFPTVICLECKEKLEQAFYIRQEFITHAERLVQLVAEEKIMDFFNMRLAESLDEVKPLTKGIQDDVYETTLNLSPIKEENGDDVDKKTAGQQFADSDFNGHESPSDIEDADKLNISEQNIPRNRKTTSGRIANRQRKKPSWESFSLNSEGARKCTADLRERARRYSQVSNRKKYKLEAEAQQRYPFTTCYVCNKNHATLMERDLHMREHIPMLPHQCTECKTSTENDECQSEENVKDKPKLLKTISQLNAHFRMHSMPHKCDKCYRRFCTSLKLKTHYWSSHGVAENGLTCEYCGKQYFQRTIFNRHIAYHRNELTGQYRCSICHRSMGSKSSLERHEASHKGEKKYKCMYCESLFSTSYNRLTHQRVVHTGERPYKCKDCGRSFIDNTRLKIHQEIHEKTEPGAKDITRKSKLLAAGKEVCPYAGCDFRAITYSAMYMHRRKVHMSLLKCEMCDKSFAFKNDLQSHLLLHTGEKPFTCETCGRSFRRVAMYRRHLQTHNASNATFTCTICQKNFKMARYLHAHMQTHSEKKFACDRCCSSFKAKSDLKRHQRGKHEITE